MAYGLPFNVDVTHFLSREESVVFQHHVVRVPDDHPKLVRFWFSRRYVQRRPRERHVHRKHVHPHLQLSLVQDAHVFIRPKRFDQILYSFDARFVRYKQWSSLDVFGH